MEHHKYNRIHIILKILGCPYTYASPKLMMIYGMPNVSSFCLKNPSLTFVLYCLANKNSEMKTNIGVAYSNNN